MRRAQRYLVCRPKRVKPDPHRPCAMCRMRRARFRFRGRVKADRFHTLCLQCFRSMRDGLRQGRRRRRLPIRAISPAQPARTALGAGTPFHGHD